jgi:8-oxo-dGTP pyrophosphatase MutT (NUDIX family)
MIRVDDFLRFKSKLSEEIKDLPGQEAHELMMPSIRRSMPMDLSKIPNAKLSSVLLLLYPVDGKLMLPLTKRHDYKGAHGGQISLPGGKHEDHESRIETALREAEEEVGVNRTEVEVLGTLTEMYIPPSNFKVLPVLGTLPERPFFIKEEFEVEKIMEVSVDEFMDAANYKVKDIQARNFTLKDTPYFDIEGHVVWGATAMILSEMAMLMKRI